MGLFSKKKKDKKPETGATSKKDEAKKAVKPADAEGKSSKKPASKKDEKKPAPRKLASDTGDAHRILIRPIVTEKSMMLSKVGQYVFEVAPGSNKIEIKKAVKAVYGVDPTDVAVMRILGKPTRGRRGRGRRKTWRKAIVTLKKGQSIELFTTKA